MFLTPAILIFSAAPAFSQTAPAFEVSDVKINKSGETRMAVDMSGGGRLTMRNVPMRVMIMMAYQARREAVTNGPSWLDSDRFDVVAKAEQTTTPDNLRLMLRALLAERFKLAIHEEPKVMPAYALVVAKSGPKMKPSGSALLSEQRCTPSAGAEGQKRLTCRNMTAAMLAGQLQEHSPRDFDVPVVNQTGLEGAFDFELEWTPAPRSAEAPAELPAAPAIFGAIQKQLGLRLEKTRLPLPVIVIDRVERVPAEN